MDIVETNVAFCSKDVPLNVQSLKMKGYVLVGCSC